MKAPPRAAAWLVQRLLTPAHAKRLLGDLDEEYLEQQLAARGIFGASVWYWRQCLTSIRALRRRPYDVFPRTRRPMHGISQDLRFAVRQFLRSPTYALAVILTFALGMGATTAIFAMVNGVLLRPLPYDSPERIVRFWAHTHDGDTTDFSFRVLEYQALAEVGSEFEYVGAEFPASAALLVPDQEPRQIQTRRVSHNYFRVFGVEPAQGRMFDATEMAAGDALVAVISHALWQRELGSDPSTIGRTIDLAGTPFEVIGVLPADYRHVSGEDIDVFFPYNLGTSGWIGRWLDLYVKVRPEFGASMAVDRVNATMDSVATEDGRERNWFATGESLHEMKVGTVRPALMASFGTAVLVLLIGCANVAMLTLARMAGRSSELSLRTALGARRGRILRQVLIENLLTALIGGAIGLGVAHLLLRGLLRIAPPTLPRMEEIAIDPTVIGVAGLATIAIATLLGLATGYRALRSAPGLGMGAGNRATGQGGSFGSLVTVEVAMAVTLLVGAGLMVRTLDRLQQENLGFRAPGVLSFRVSAPSARHPGAEGTLAFYDQLRDELLALQGVESVGVGSDLPVSGEGAVATLRSEERVRAGDTDGVTSLQRRANADFFETLGVPLLAGRNFGPEDTPESAPVLIISQSLASSLFGAGDPVGQRVSFRREPQDDDWMTVIGVVGDVRYQRIDQVEEPQLYQAHAQSAVREMAVMVRSQRSAEELIGDVRHVVSRIDSAIPLYDVQTLEAITDTAMADRRFVAMLVSAFAAVAVALSMAGVYGVLAMLVGRQRRAIALRMALGATPEHVTGRVVRHGMRWVVAGLALGLVGAFAVTRLLTALLYGVSASDPATYGIGTLLLAIVATLAAYLPARRAAALQPAEALRED
ncbi:MAG: FtsX-like permease family protein [Acidobacteria bacterium]|nr:FtsX-like permease family protein [Acidobacteriota bacterium]